MGNFRDVRFSRRGDYEKKRYNSPMKAAFKFLSAASAVALSAALVVPGAVAVQFAFVSAAQAAVVSSIEVQRQSARRCRDHPQLSRHQARQVLFERRHRRGGEAAVRDRPVLRRAHQPGRLDAGRQGLRILGRQPGAVPGQQEAQGRRACGRRPVASRAARSRRTRSNADVEAIKAAYSAHRPRRRRR